MNILIVGCGKVGSQLSNVLSRMGHDVAVIDQNPAHFSSLADDFSGYNVTGVPIDQDVLRRGGIEKVQRVPVADLFGDGGGERVARQGA